MGDDPAKACGAKPIGPFRPDNRPRLAALDYRVGTQPEFVRRMEWRLPRQTVTDPETEKTLTPLAGLRAREASDPTIALLDAFATSLDVLSFYSERVANEGYLGTAVQRRSIVELGRTVGYELAPGVAASVHLAFTVEDSDDPFRTVEIAAGVQAMSVPAKKGELPQVFETVETIVAHAEWNAMKVRTEQPQNLALRFDPNDPAESRLYLFDLDNSFDEAVEADEALERFETTDALDGYYPLDPALDLAASLSKLIEDHSSNPAIDPALRAVPVDELYLRGIGLGLSAGQRLVVVGVRVDEEDERHVATALLRVVSAEEDRAYGITTLIATPHGSAPEAVRRPPRFRVARLPVVSMPTQRLAFNAANVDTMVRAATWSGPALSALVRSQSWSRPRLLRLIRLPRPVRVPETSEAQPGLYALREDSGFFGCTAPLQEQLAPPPPPPPPPPPRPYPESWDKPPRTIWVDSQGDAPSEAHVFLEREIRTIVPNGWAAVESPDNVARIYRVADAAAQSRADFGISGKATGVKFRTADGGTDIDKPDDFKFRTARLFGASEALELAGAPVRDDVDEATIDLASLYLDIERGRAVSITGNRSDADGLDDSETLIVSDVVHIGGFTRLLLETAPQNSYERSSVRVNANMALATHGERFVETLGSGDAATANQVFTLAKKPLTFVSADTVDGRASTLEIRVDGILWQEVPSLYWAGPDERVYEVRLEDDGSTRVRFGDGKRGQRLPTGSLNVSASYRAGIGAAGEVADEAIIQLKTRPLGVRGVVNPSAASGSGEAETLEEARSAVPRGLLTLGRIVSLSDYRDFAVGFAGVGKASADALWSGQERVVALTVAPVTDSILDSSATLLASLESAVGLVGDGTDRVVVLPYQRRYFQLSARLFRRADHLADAVAESARAALLAGFGYEARDLMQPVSAAEAVALLQAVPGVVGVDLDTLALLDSDEPPPEGAAFGLAAILPARPARLLPQEEGGDILPAELLTILDSAIVLIVEDANA